MPQLNPAPWFLILIFTWTIFLAMMLPKIMAQRAPLNPLPHNTKAPVTKTWTWPWR
uniref:ATP synthase complex subunit 8 n=1 Tax=Champsodon cf. snyderi CBM-ZF 10876 TaxID=270612 RepID=T2HTC0_9TELE|nr:ATP synthase F0 subunit 8 [Champsodon cf. snyderi CBM-ZF 10876]BAN83382.1 ATPase subunit 8 [Champsodon cf. snyderi CBM-ZF 10876]